MPDIIHIDMDCFFAAVEVKDNPDLRGKPVIVGALPGTRGVVSACSYEARKFGIHSAMPISAAYKKCPDGVYLKPNGKRYMEESNIIMDIFARYTPLVEPLSLDEAFLDISGSHRLFGVSVEIGRAIKEQILNETGLIASVGIAPTKFVAKIASDIEKPDGFVVVNDNEVFDFLWPLEARKIWGVGKTTEKKLDKLGLKTIGDIAKYPARELERIFGKTGRHLHNLANNIDERSVAPETERKSVGNEHTFGEDTGDIEEVERVLLALSDKVAGRLSVKGLKGKKITLKLRNETFKTVTRSKTLPQRIKSGEEIFSHAKKMFRAEWNEGMLIRLIGVSVSGFDDDEQLSLLEDASAQQNRVEDLLSDIRGKFGKSAITRASLIEKNKK